MKFNTVKQGGSIVGVLKLSPVEAKFFKSKFVSLEGFVEDGLHVKQGTTENHDIIMGSTPNSKTRILRIPVRYFSKHPNRLTEATDIHGKFAEDTLILDKLNIENFSGRPARNRVRVAALSKGRRTVEKSPIDILTEGVHQINRLAQNLGAKMWVSKDGRLKVQVQKIITIE